MPGVREKQKADRARRILKAAVTRFRGGGYRSVRIEDIAQMAGVSVGTVYNYYQTKGDILIAVVALEVEEVLAAGTEVVADPPTGAEPALLKLMYGYYDHSLDYLTKDMWRTAMAQSIEAPGTRNGRLYSDLDLRLAAQVIDLICALQCRGEVCAAVDARALGMVIFSTLNQAFIDFVKDDQMTLRTLKARVAEQIAPLAGLMAPPR